MSAIVSQQDLGGVSATSTKNFDGKKESVEGSLQNNDIGSIQPSINETQLQQGANQLNKAQRKQLEQKLKEEQEREKQLQLEEKLAQEKQEKEENEFYKSQNRIGLDFIHAFGVYSGPQEYDISGQIHVIKDLWGGFKNKKQNIEFDSGPGSNFHTLIGEKSIQNVNQSDQNDYANLVIVYPVGRHIAFKSLETNKMKFLYLPLIAKEVTSMIFNYSYTVLAIAVKQWVPEQYEHHDLLVYFYNINKDGSFKNQKQLRIKATKGDQGHLQQAYLTISDKNKAHNNTNIKKEAFNRYIQSMAFSKDEKYFALCIRNGPKECYIQHYDYQFGNKRIGQLYVDIIVNQIQYFPKDSLKLVISGENTFKFYTLNNRKFEPLNNFDDLPIRKGQITNFVSFCYCDNDQLIGCSEQGDIFVIEIMQVVQTISTKNLIAYGTQVGNRLQFKKVIANKFGFIAASNDVLYFFQFKKSSDLSQGKGTYNCILKWRASQFLNTYISSINVFEGTNIQDSTLAITTKNNQILYVNLYKQIYFPDRLKILNDLKAKSQQNQSSSSQQNDSESDDDMDEDDSDYEISHKNKRKIKSVGIEEENIVESHDSGDSDQLINKAELKRIQEMKENEALIDEIKYEVVASGFHQGEISCIDICIQRPIIASLSKQDSSIRIWNYDSGQQEFYRNYSHLSKDIQNYLLYIALHPSGLYLAIAFADKVKVYHLLHQEMREYRSLDIKNCQMLKFSHGGQYLACIEKDNLTIFHSYTLEKLNKKDQKLSLPSKDITSMYFNENDTIIALLSKDGQGQRYDLVKLQKLGDQIIEKQCKFTSCIFAKFQKRKDLIDKNYKENKILEPEYIYAVGQRNEKSMSISCYNDKNDELVKFNQNFSFGATKFTDLLNIVAHQDIQGEYDQSKRARNLLVSLDNGRIQQYSHQPNLQPGYEIEVYNTHQGAINMMKKSFDNQIIVTAGADGTIFIYKTFEVQGVNFEKYSQKVEFQIQKIKRYLQQQKQDIQEVHKIESEIIIEEEDGSIDKDNIESVPIVIQQKKVAESDSDDSDLDNALVKARKNMEQLTLFIDDRLSNIVLIEKYIMDEWRKQQEQLKLDMEKENNTVESSLRQEKYRYEKRIADMERIKSEKLNQLNNAYEDLQKTESDQMDENTQEMKKSDLNHMQCMEELQCLYEKKMQIQIKQYVKLNQQKNEMKRNFEEQISYLYKLNEQAVEKLLNTFKEELQTVQFEYEKQKRTQDGLKMIYEEKLNQTEEDNMKEIEEIQKSYKKEIEELNKVVNTIKDEIEKEKRDARREQDEIEKNNQIIKLSNNKRDEREKQNELKLLEIKQLEDEKGAIQEKLKEKEKDLYKYKFHIKELQKNKLVLTHRTQENYDSIKPKDQQIENLKDELLKLEKKFNIQFQAIKNLKKDMENREEKIKELKKKVEKETKQTKQKELIISKFVNKVQLVYKHINDDSIQKKLMDIYNEFVKQHTDQLQNKVKDPEMVEELQRQLEYMEKSIGVLKSSTIRNQSKTKFNINKRRQENNSLIQDLDQVRKSKKELEIQLEGKQLSIQKIKLEKQKMQREFNSKLNEVENETLQQVKTAGTGTGSQQQNNQKDNFFSEQDGENNLYKKISSKEFIGSSFDARPDSKLKGRLYKGTPFIRGKVEDKNKINELNQQLEENNQQILLQKLEKRSLQEQIIRLLDERADELGLTEDEKKSQLSKLNIQAFQQ